MQRLSRSPFEPEVLRDVYGETHGSGIHIHGRLVLNLWRILRSELKLPRYSIEHVVQHAFKRTWPVWSYAQLTEWYKQDGSTQWRTLEHYKTRAKMNLTLLSHYDLITRNR